VSFLPAVSSGLTTLAVKVARGAMLTPVALVALIALIQLLVRALAALGERRSWPVLGCAVGAAAYMMFGFMPALSQQLSPRGVYDTYNQLAKPSEVLGEYNVRSRAAAYYAKGKPREIESLTALVDHLLAAGRQWAVFPAEELTEIDRAFRVRSRRHLFIADDRNPHAVLATNEPVAGLVDKNRLSSAVLFEAPKIATPLHINFDDKVHLLGYKLDLPRSEGVGQGEHFEITWYFRALRAVPGNYRIFVHIDGPGARIGGDHDPVEGAYPIRQWAAGDVIVDRQRIDVPATAARGDYVIYMGLYSGDTRLPVKEGPHDPVDRAITGALLIR
jgi:hypothetical protein